MKPWNGLAEFLERDKTSLKPPISLKFHLPDISDLLKLTSSNCKVVSYKVHWVRQYMRSLKILSECDSIWF